MEFLHWRFTAFYIVCNAHIVGYCEGVITYRLIFLVLSHRMLHQISTNLTPRLAPNLFDKLEFVGEYMKNLYIVGGTMGVGKTAVCQQLKMNLSNSVLLDGDWCWDSNPFQVTDETKSMVMDNICYLLNNFLHCSAYENVIFCWVMHQQSIIDSIVEKLDTQSCDVKCISLIVDEANLRKRLTKDVESGIRVEDIIERSITRIPMYDTLDTIKIDTNEKTVAMIANEIKLL